MQPEAALDMSYWALILQAHWVVKLVMLGLLAASVATWAIIINKWLLFRRVKAQMDRFEDVFWSGQSLEELYRTLSQKPTSGMASLFIAAMREWKRAFEGTGRGFASLQTRIDKVLDVTIQREVERLEGKLLVLATTASASPFVGLFGTVWGIMNSFTSIAGSGNTSLAVVAPGIAEALFATAMGLLAAIPAVLSYNKFSTDLGRYADRLDTFSGEFSAILSRHLEERGAA
jgi:biopolymer transport protein TolQ